jgi:alpha-amylase
VADSGNDVWKWSFKTSEYVGSYTGTMPQKIIFNNSDNGKQTSDLDFVNGGYYNINGLLGAVTTGISTVTIDRSVSGKVYTLDGRVVNSNGSLDNLSRGIYVIDGKKVVIK